MPPEVRAAGLQRCNLADMEHSLTTAKPRPLLTRPEAARKLGLSLPTLAKALDAGQLPAVRLGARQLIPAGAVEELLNGGPK